MYNPILNMESFPKTSFPDGSCVTLGVFDGVHRGHQAIIKRLIERAKEHTIPAIIFITEPHPQQILYQRTIPTLTSLQQRTSLLLHYAQEYAQGAIPVYCIRLPFTYQLAEHSAYDFIHKILTPFCSVRHIVLGEGASFGKDKVVLTSNDFYSVEYVETVLYEQDAISATRIRKYIQEGYVEHAFSCLGRYYSSDGVVVHGYKRGSTLLGFPTANITIPSTLLPSQGVYATYVHYQNKRYKGVMNIGTNPTFSGNTLSLEVHIIDFNFMIYGSYLYLEYGKKLRNEHHFTSVSSLISQIQQDIEESKHYLK